MATSMDILKRHLGRPGTLELKCKDGSIDKIEINLLPVKLIPEFYSLFEGFGEINKDDSSSFFKAFNKESMETLSLLMKETLKVSYPEADDDLLDKFIVSNYFELMNKIFEVNMPTPTDDTRIKKKLKDLQEKRKKVKETKKE